MHIKSQIVCAAMIRFCQQATVVCSREIIGKMIGRRITGVAWYGLVIFFY